MNGRRVEGPVSWFVLRDHHRVYVNASRAFARGKDAVTVRAAPRSHPGNEHQTARRRLAFVIASTADFPFDSNVVATSARDTLLRVGRELTELGIDRALVRGHTDNVGTNDYNLPLSKRRADAVARVLTDGGCPTDKIDSNDLGAAVLTADNNTAQGREQNHRVLIIAQIISRMRLSASR